MEGRNVHPSRSIPAARGTVAHRELCSPNYMTRLMKYIEYHEEGGPMHDTYSILLSRRCPDTKRWGTGGRCPAAGESFQKPRQVDYRTST